MTNRPSRKRKAARRDYSRASRTRYLPYPATILDPALLDQIGVIAGTRPDEDPPKVVMTLGDWQKLRDDPRLAKRAIHFLGTTWQDNPLIRPPAAAKVSNPLVAALPKPIRVYKPRVKRPHRFAHLLALPFTEAVGRAQTEHAARLAEGVDAAESMGILSDALEAIKRAVVNHVEPRPLAAMMGEDPPTPTELRRQAAG